MHVNFKPRIWLQADGAVRDASSARASVASPPSYSVHRGALLYSLPLHYTYKQTAHYYASSNDYDVTPASPWAWALDWGVSNNVSSHPIIDDVSAAMRFVYDGWTPDSAPFNKTANPSDVATGAFFPCKVSATVRDISKLWSLQPDGAKGGGGWSPRLPPTSLTCTGSGSSHCGAPTEVMLVPHGGTALRMGTLPLSGL